MSIYNVYTDKIENSGNISKESILNKYSQELIFSLVFGYIPEEFERVTSPFREDNNPGCWFNYDYKGSLKFVDFGNSDTINGIKMHSIDCFNAVAVHFDIDNFIDVLYFIDEKLKDVDITKEQRNNIIRTQEERVKKKVQVVIKTRFWQVRDKSYWESYGITRKNLEDDGVFPVDSFKLLNTRFGNKSYQTELRLCYAFTDFKDSRKKVYLPESEMRFMGNTGKNDVGGIGKLKYLSEILVITKSYKDWRVLANQGIESIWYQSETSFPDNSEIEKTLFSFKRIVIFFDSDEVGVQAGENLKKHYKDSLNLDVELVHIPDRYNKAKDPSDLFKEYGEETLIQFLKEYKLI